MKLFCSPLLPAVLLLMSLAPARADLQLGLGGGAYAGSEYDEEIGYALQAEFGYLSQDAPVNLFLGFRGSYVDGLESSGSILDSKDNADLDLFEESVVARLLVPLGTDVVKLYGEGSAGAANMRVSGDAKVSGNIGGQEFSVNSQFDERDWVFAWGLGAGLQFDFTRNIGLRVGYNFHSFGDSDVFGLNLDSGNIQGVTSALIFKF